METVRDITSGNPGYRAYSLTCLVGGLYDVWVEVLHSRGDRQCLDIRSEQIEMVASQFCAENSCDIAAASHILCSAIPAFLTTPSVTINSLSPGFGTVIEREVESAFMTVERPHIASQST